MRVNACKRHAPCSSRSSPACQMNMSLSYTLSSRSPCIKTGARREHALTVGGMCLKIWHLHGLRSRPEVARAMSLSELTQLTGAHSQTFPSQEVPMQHRVALRKSCLVLQTFKTETATLKTLIFPETFKHCERPKVLQSPKLNKIQSSEEVAQKWLWGSTTPT